MGKGILLQKFLIFCSQNVLAFDQLLDAYLCLINFFFHRFGRLFDSLVLLTFRRAGLAFFSLQPALAIPEFFLENFLFLESFLEPVHDFRGRHGDKHLVFLTFKELNLFLQGIVFRLQGGQLLLVFLRLVLPLFHVDQFVGRNTLMLVKGMMFFDAGIDQRQGDINDQSNGCQDNRFFCQFEFHNAEFK